MTEMRNGNDGTGLAANPLFRQLSQDALQKLSKLMSTVSFKSRDTIFLEREPGDALYLVDAGRVRIWVHDGDRNEITLAELEPELSSVRCRS